MIYSYYTYYYEWQYLMHILVWCSFNEKIEEIIAANYRIVLVQGVQFFSLW